jgi:DNA-binding MurR/RpiR family transcriptional regulator
MVLDNPGAAAELTISELAQAAGTSETTVTRFCRNIGLRGYAQLRLHLAAEAERQRADARPDVNVAGDITPADSTAEVIGGYADARAVEDTVAHLDTDAPDRLVAAIDRAGRIDVYGVGWSAIVAVDAARNSSAACTMRRRGPIHTAGS